MRSTSLCKIITFSLIVGILFLSTGIGQHDADAIWGWAKKRLKCWSASATCASLTAGAVAVCTSDASGWLCAKAATAAAAACLKALDECS